MSVRTFSEMTFYSILSLERLGRKASARKLASSLLDYARQLTKTPAKIDYFATSLPTMLTGTRRFLTFDKRQRALARAAGLEVKP